MFVLFAHFRFQYEETIIIHMDCILLLPNGMCFRTTTRLSTFQKSTSSEFWSVTRTTSTNILSKRCLPAILIKAEPEPEVLSTALLTGFAKSVRHLILQCLYISHRQDSHQGLIVKI